MSVTAVIAIVDVVFILLLILGFFIGFMRGVKRSLLEFILSFMGILVVGFITPIVTNAILGIQITVNGETSSLQSFFVSYIVDNTNYSSLVENSPTLASFLEFLPSVLMCAVIFLILNLLMRILVYVFYKIIEVIVFKSKKKEKEQGLKRNKWFGGVIGALKMFVLLLAFSMPLMSMVKLVDQNLLQNSASASTSAENTNSDFITEASEFMPPIVKNIISGLNKSAFGVLDGAVGLDDFIFDNISQFELNGEKVQVRKEIVNYIDAYKELSKYDFNSVKFAQIDWDKLDKIYSNMTDSGLFKGVVLEIAGELIDEYNTLITLFPELERYEQIFSDVKIGLSKAENTSAYLKSDVDNLYFSFRNLAKSGYLDEVIAQSTENFDFSEALTTLSVKYPAILTDVVNRIGNINIIKDSFSSTLDMVIETFSGSTIGEIIKDANTEITKWANFKEDFKNAINNFASANMLIKEQGVSLASIVSEPINILLIKDNVPTILSYLGDFLDVLDNMEIFVDKQDVKIFPQILETFGIENLLEVNGEEINNYKELFEYISGPFDRLLKLDLYETFKNDGSFNEILLKVAEKLANEKMEKPEGEIEYSSLLSDIILPLYKMTIVRDKFINDIITESAKTNIVDFSLLEVENNFELSYLNWQKDLPLLSQIITELYNHDYSDNQNLLQYLINGGDINEAIKKLDDQTVDLIVPAILQAKSTEPLKEKLEVAILDSMKALTGDQTLTVSFSSATFESGSDEDQTQEIVNIVKNFIAIYSEGEDFVNLSEVDSVKLGQFLEAMKINAYRTENGKNEQGVMWVIFDALIEKAENEYNVEFLSVFNVSSVNEIDFTRMFELLSLADGADDFAKEFTNVVFEKATQQENLMALLDAVENNLETAEIMLEIVVQYPVQLNLTQEVKTAVQEKLEQLSVSQDILNNLKQLLGV